MYDNSNSLKFLVAESEVEIPYLFRNIKFQAFWKCFIPTRNFPFISVFHLIRF